jgi:hypothetical protein
METKAVSQIWKVNLPNEVICIGSNFFLVGRGTPDIGAAIASVTTPPTPSTLPLDRHPVGLDPSLLVSSRFSLPCTSSQDSFRDKRKVVHRVSDENLPEGCKDYPSYGTPLQGEGVGRDLGTYQV